MTDNRAGWDRIAAAYQAQRGWPHTSLYWGIRLPPEEEMRLLGDVRGRRALVLGCGGGQDCVALARLGARDIVGVDASAAQLEHARALLEAEAVTARLLQGSVEDLGDLPDGSFDLAVSVHVLTYVRRADACLAEAFRVLASGGTLAFSVHHPVDAATDDAAPHGFVHSYFERETEWAWSAMGGDEAPMRSWHRPVTEWFTLARAAGFQVERMLEPRGVDLPIWRASGWGSEPYYGKLEVVPGTLIVVASKP